jgi:hypothetical protein
MGTSETVFLVKEQIKTIPQAGKGQKGVMVAFFMPPLNSPRSSWKKEDSLDKQEGPARQL